LAAAGEVDQQTLEILLNGNPPAGAEVREHLLPPEPDQADTQGYDARAEVDHCGIVRPLEQSCPLCEPEKPNSDK
jgi:hypothetical protein